MRRKKKYRTDHHGYTSSLLGESLIPGGLNIYSNHKQVKAQIRAIEEKEKQYIEKMSGECITYYRK